MEGESFLKRNICGYVVVLFYFILFYFCLYFPLYNVLEEEKKPKTFPH